MAARDVGAQAIIPLSPYQVSVSYGNPSFKGNVGGWFGPLAPMPPVAPPETAGRIFDFPTGYNLNTRPRPYERVGFAELRALADNYDLLRLVIETRKDQVERMRWSIAPRADKFDKTTGQEAPQSLIDNAKDIEAKLRKPDGFMTWRPWLRSLLEDLFVIDAPTLYRRPTRGGDVFGYDVIDGATIKPVIDTAGRIIAFQQVLKGVPAVDYSIDELIYRPRNVRSNRVYGFSPVEQIIMTVNIALRRQVWQLQYYTEGNVPDALIGVSETWTPDQIAKFQTYWDTLFEGNTAQRRHAKFVPGGAAKTYIPTKEPELKNVFDEWLARVVCFAFSISPQPFTAQVNRATAETAHAASLEEGLEPILLWIKDLIDERLVEDFGEDDIEFKFDEDVEVDPKVQQDILTGYTGSGLMRINEARQRLGLEPDDDPAADVLMVKTATGYVPIGANTIDGKLEAQDKLGPPQLPGATNPDGSPKPPAPGAPGQPAPGGEKKPNDPKATSDKPEVGKAVGIPFVKGMRRLPPVRADRKFAKGVARSLRERIAKVLAAVAKPVVKTVRSELKGVAKADETEEERQRRIQALADRIAHDVDLSGLDVLYDVTVDELEQLVRNTGNRVLAQLGVSDEQDLVDQVNERAVEMAEERAAEMVGKKWVGGELVDNPNAEYAITDATRDMVRNAIAGGLRDNIGLDEIAANIEALGFSEERADLIARAEVTRANSDAALVSYGAARDAGVKVRKEWLVADNPCPICEENGDAGVLDIDDEFPSGDDAPPAHPRCECAVSPVVEDDADEAEPDDAEKDDVPRDREGRFASVQSSAQAAIAWFSDKSVGEVATAVVSSHAAKEALASAISGAISHIGQFNDPNVDEIISLTIYNFSAAVGVSRASAHETISRAVNALARFRRGELKKHADQVLHILLMLQGALAAYDPDDE